MIWTAEEAPVLALELLAQKLLDLPNRKASTDYK